MEQGHASIQQIFGNLIQESKRELRDFVTELKDTVAELTQVCQTKEQFKRNQDKLMEVNNRRPQLQGKIEPIKKKFEFIMDDNYSDIGTGTFELTEEDKALLLNIDQEWKNFTLGMTEAKNVIQKCLQDFKQNMEENIEEFKREVLENREKFNNQAPKKMIKDFEAENNKRAFDQISHFQQECKALRKTEEEMQFGLEIFGMESTKLLELDQVEKENASLLTIWNIKQEWDHNWNKWKVIHFTDLEMEEMDNTSQEIQFKLKELTKEEKKWNVTEVLTDRIYNFLNTLPLITWLREESMRPRHWKELRIEVKEDFDENS